MLPNDAIQLSEYVHVYRVVYAALRALGIGQTYVVGVPNVNKVILTAIGAEPEDWDHVEWPREAITATLSAALAGAGLNVEKITFNE